MINGNIVFDRDGTLIKHIPYLSDPEKVELFNDTKESLKLLKNNGFKFHLHTNQSGIARGYFTIQNAIECNKRLISLLEMGDDIFKDICIAEDFPAKNNSYRKPSPKFGLELIEKYNLNKNYLVYIGDSLSDLQTAKNIGCLSFGVNTGLVDLNSNSNNDFDISKNLSEVVKKILNI